MKMCIRDSLSLTGMTFPIYIGAMIAAAIIRNVGEYGGGYTVYMGEIKLCIRDRASSWGSSDGSGDRSGSRPRAGCGY